MNPLALTPLRALLAEHGYAAYLAYTPSNVLYTTGYNSYFLSNWWRMHGTVLALIPTDEAVPPALMVSDFEQAAATAASGFTDVRAFRLWVESRPLSALEDPGSATLSRPAQYDPAEQDELVRGMLSERGLDTAHIGTDLRYILKDSYDRLTAACPDVTWGDATEVLYRARSIKQPHEVEYLRRATELSEAGMRHAAEALDDGMTAVDVERLYTQGVLATAMGNPRYADYSDSWVIPAVGAATSPNQRGSRGLTPGDLVKFDCGTTVGGYRGDGGRTFAYRHVTASAQRLHDILLEAHEAARARIAPGTPIRDVFAAAQDHVRRSGYPGYTRGHIGHSVGLDTFHEEPPYLSPEEQRRLEPGMVLAVETPFYGSDVGAIMIEDLVHVTADGHEVLHRLPHDLVVVGGA